ncbi:MAG: FAD-dependent oxidoreductase [Synechococcus sp. MED-G133]|jgi:hypothetical protein|nr:FAD-dependent oxidoreductase [Synechococcus sp.]RZO09299.1 MAG: FAD-dependent oxidoreductase [Synechococcus sp. MED-G133]|tara:strand:- start:2198 stop:3955 length:1758 start_codon:yes stop_codon:yes gene_type:complete
MAWDVIVWGGGTGGVAAAVQASRSGAQTLLLTPGPWLGGMLSAAGVSAPDGHELSCWQTGLWGQFIRTLAATVPEGLDQNWVSCFGFRPQQAEHLLQSWVQAEPLLQWWSGCCLLGLDRRGDRIQALDLECNGERHRLDSRIWVDGSDLGDLIALADAPFRWGWESKDTWNEPSAPSADALATDAFFRQQPVQSPTWVVMGQLTAAAPESSALSAPAAPFDKALEAVGLERTLTYGRLPGGLVMLNWPLGGNDWHHGLGRSIAPLASEREALDREMQQHSLQFLDQLSRCSGGWLSRGDAFPSARAHLALMPYWREGRRMRGQSVVTERDLLPVTTQARRSHLSSSSIAVGTYANDHHYPGEDWPLAPKSCRWGGRWTGTPFCIPFGALLSADVSNLLAAEKCFSVSHMANGATRLQPLILNIGQAAGLAAALAVRMKLQPSELPVDSLQQQLIDDPQAPAAVMPVWDWPCWHPHWREAQHRSLRHPEILMQDGSLEAAQGADLSLPDAAETPAERHGEQLQGQFRRDADGLRYWLESGSIRRQLITLEPAVERVLSAAADGTPMDLVAVHNPWGPWWRVSQVLR